MTFGTFDNVLIQNTDDINRREYQALLFFANYRVTPDWAVSFNWTHQFKNEANFEGEAANQPGNYSLIHDRPEFYDEERHFPFGRTDDYQAEKVRLYTVYDLQLGKAGTASVGGSIATTRRPSTA